MMDTNGLMSFVNQVLSSPITLVVALACAFWGLVYQPLRKAAAEDEAAYRRWRRQTPLVPAPDWLVELVRKR